MTIPFTRWPEEFARRYREKGYWQDLPLTHILTDRAESDAVAIVVADSVGEARDAAEAVVVDYDVLPAVTFEPGDPARIHISASHKPAISPNIWLISGAVVKSPSAPSGSRVV